MKNFMKKDLFKRVISMMLVLVLSVALLFVVGCGDDKSGNNNDGGEQLTGKAQEAAEGRNDFINEIGGVSDTFAGAVSTESYDTAEAAAEDFVTKEVVGDNVAVIDYTDSKGTLTSSEVASLNLPDDVADGVKSVEKIEVGYSIKNEDTASNGVMTCSAYHNKVETVTVYVIKYEVDWKYFVPRPVNGETISKSYYDSIINDEKYANCTLTSESVIYADIEISAEGYIMSGTMKITTTQTIKYADDKIFFNQVVKSENTGIYAGDDTDSTLQGYISLNDDGSCECYVSVDGVNWQRGSLVAIGFSDIKSMRPFYDNDYLDYTYFNKTDYGFALSGENAKAYLDAAFDDVLSMVDGMDWDADMFAEYYVSDGTLTGMRTDADISFEGIIEGCNAQMNESVKSTITIKDYGTTVVEDPTKD